MRRMLLHVLIGSSILFGTHQLTAQTDGDALFGAATIHDVSITFPQTGYWDSLVAYMPLEQYLKVDITIDGILFTNVGVKFKGNSSYNNASNKKSFKVDMNEFTAGQEVDGLKKFNLNNGFKDPSFLREKLALDFYNEQGIIAPRCAFSRVYLNGDYWGLYTFVEEIDNTFLKDDDRFNNKQGNLFKGDPNGDLKWINSTVSSYYPKYELHNNDIENDWTDLVNLIDNINNSGSDLYDSLETVLNTTHFIQQWAGMNLFVNLDSYIGSGHNYYIYHDTLTDKFEWIAWDVNESFGNFNMGLSNTELQQLSMFHVSSPSSSRPLIQQMLTVPLYKSTLAQVMCEWVVEDFSNATLDAKIDSLADVIRAAVYADPNKFYTNANFETNLTSDLGPTMGLKSFITARRNALLTELADFGCYLGEIELASNQSISVFPNPVKDLFTVRLIGMGGINKIKIVNVLGQVMYAVQTDQAEQLIDVSSFSDGIYLVIINDHVVEKIQKVAF